MEYPKVPRPMTPSIRGLPSLHVCGTRTNFNLFDRGILICLACQPYLGAVGAFVSFFLAVSRYILLILELSDKKRLGVASFF